MTRGIRNNNPFNIRRTAISWKGESSSTNENEFEVFKEMDYGVRAGVKLLHNYIRNGYDTPYKIIHRFAPGCENDCESYLKFLIKKGYIQDIHERYYISTPHLYLLCAGICKFESCYILTSEMYSRVLKML